MDSGASPPSKQTPRPEISQACTEVFRIAAPSVQLDADAIVLTDTKPALASIAEPGRMRDGGYCDPAEIEKLWAQKTRLDAVFDAGESGLYWRVREELYPAGPQKQTKAVASGRRRSRGACAGNNRAGDKLAEILEAVGGLGDSLKAVPDQETVFLDICGAPGAWSNYLYAAAEEQRTNLRGYGFSLRDGTNRASCTWYEELMARGDFAALWGANGTGDVTSIENIEHVSAVIGHKASIVLADGAYGVGSNWGGEHLENYQEIIAGRVIISEVLVMLETICAGGCFVCKLFDTFSHLTVSLIFVTAALFEEVFIVKPHHSRVVNSERYLVCKRFTGPSSPHLVALHKAVKAALAVWPPPGDAGPWSGLGPISVLPTGYDLESIAPAFCQSVRSMTSTLCCKQSVALETVIDRVVALMSTEPITDGKASCGVNDAKRKLIGGEEGRMKAVRGPVSAHGKAVSGAAAGH